MEEKEQKEEQSEKKTMTEIMFELKKPMRASKIGGVRLLVRDDTDEIYANGMTVLYTSPTEFRLHFYDVTYGDDKGPIGVVKSIVILNPVLIRKIIGALETNLKSYEEKFGKIEESKIPAEPLAKVTEVKKVEFEEKQD